MTTISVITPLGLGHEGYLAECGASAEAAAQYAGVALEHLVCVDGGDGRSACRNDSLEDATGDWVFFLDADDLMTLDAIDAFLAIQKENPDYDGYFGMVGGTARDGSEMMRVTNRYPGSWDDLVTMDMMGLLCISGFFRLEAAQDIGFCEATDTAETWEFALAFAAKYRWMKAKHLFTNIRCDRPSASGPRGYAETRLDWFPECQPVRKFWRERGPRPMTREERSSAYWK